MSVNPPMAIIGTERATLIRDSDPPVYLLPGGKFAVKVDDQWLKFNTLKALDKKLSNVEPSVRLVRLCRSIGDPFASVMLVGDIVKLEQRWAISAKGKKLNRSYLDWYVFDEKLIQALRELHTEFEEVSERYRKRGEAIIRKLKIVQDNEHLQRLKREANRKKAASNS